jgi:uncharacterized protein (TIGR03546 family)
LAQGLALGVFIGVMPKDSAICWLAGLVLLFSDGSLLLGMAAAFAVSAVAVWMDPVTGSIGSALLHAPAGQTIWTRLSETPFWNWTRLDNTVVMGSVCVAALLSFATYVVSLRFLARRGDRMAQWINRSAVCRWMLAVDPAPPDAVVSD